MNCTVDIDLKKKIPIPIKPHVPMPNYLCVYPLCFKNFINYLHHLIY